MLFFSRIFRQGCTDCRSRDMYICFARTTEKQHLRQQGRVEGLNHSEDVTFLSSVGCRKKIDRDLDCVTFPAFVTDFLFALYTSWVVTCFPAHMSYPMSYRAHQRFHQSALSSLVTCFPRVLALVTRHALVLVATHFAR